MFLIFLITVHHFYSIIFTLTIFFLKLENLIIIKFTPRRKLTKSIYILFNFKKQNFLRFNN